MINMMINHGIIIGVYHGIPGSHLWIADDLPVWSTVSDYILSVSVRIYILNKKRMSGLDLMKIYENLGSGHSANFRGCRSLRSFLFSKSWSQDVWRRRWKHWSFLCSGRSTSTLRQDLAFWNGRQNRHHRWWSCWHTACCLCFWRCNDRCRDITFTEVSRSLPFPAQAIPDLLLSHTCSSIPRRKQQPTMLLIGSLRIWIALPGACRLHGNASAKFPRPRAIRIPSVLCRIESFFAEATHWVHMSRLELGWNVVHTDRSTNGKGCHWGGIDLVLFFNPLRPEDAFPDVRYSTTARHAARIGGPAE